jgi:hypothetical protein
MSDLTLGKLLQESYQRFKLSLRKYSLKDHKNYAFCLCLYYEKLISCLTLEMIDQLEGSHDLFEVTLEGSK